MQYSNKIILKTAIKVGSRQSNLARAQVNEVLQEIRRFHPSVEFEVQYVATYGDKDQTSSLRTLDKTDFFTKEIDEMLLSCICRIAIHSAKDLPEPLPAGLTLICLTEGLDSSDSLVLRQGTRIEDLREGAFIATSSARREESVNRLRKGFNFMDIRGTIEQRLTKLERGQADGVVVAEAALIRLELTHLNRIKLPLPGVKGQGQLAIVAQEDDHEMAKLFACLDVRKHSKRVLYFGLDPTNFVTQGAVTHAPLIQIVPYPLDEVKAILEQFSRFTHIILTSKSTVSILISYLEMLGFTHESWANKIIAVVGKATAQHLNSHGLIPQIIAKEETAEGLIAELETLSYHFKEADVFWPHSKLSRPLLKEYFIHRQMTFTECLLYDTLPLRPCPLPKLEEFDEIVFSSPSTIDAFLTFYDRLPKNKNLVSIGPITEHYLKQILKTKLAKLD